LRNSLPGLLDCFDKYLQPEDAVRDYRREGDSKSYPETDQGYRWSSRIEDINYLKALHYDAYSYEKEYVIGTWGDLIDIYVNSDIPKQIIACYSAEKLIGCAIGYLYPSHAYIYSLCVLSGYQDHGIGTELMRRFINLSGNMPIELKVYRNNEKALAMYERYGFQFTQLSSIVVKTDHPE
ncbi:MAG TPA: GNAT family N-acetyltransferase, partial [Candidatus Cloacimonadota bacterium]|nr:GNAT family N-acetyltransferase [Candidatus Cloacimonadota bacterium]